MLLVVGDVITDVVARHDKPLARGTDTAARIALLPGGAGANCAAWAAHCGARVRLLTRAGADAADWHRAELRRAGVEPHVVVDPEAPTGTVIALVDGSDPAAERSFLTDSGAAFRAGPDDWSAELLRDVTRVHLSGYLYFSPNGRALAALATAAAHERGVPVSVDPASTGFIEELGVRAFAAAIRDADVLLPNAAEATLLTGLDDPAEAASALAAAHGTAVVTLGGAGAVVAFGPPPVRVRAPRASALDSTGAGDAFNGGYLAACTAGARPEEAAKAGCRAGALAVTTVGGRPPNGGGAARKSERAAPS
ncbi:carbohydrate kinase family protein [Streptomyces boninensis]|uniref:carbohydrate kinase family protein n=1 Tax=Streptomyces boninensis TaxID=2039455 RepID=UPI003B220D86